MKQYDNYSIREALHNAIAHQDYTLMLQPHSTEKTDKVAVTLVFHK